MNVPILLYHALYTARNSREKYAIGRDAFEAQIRYLHENGFGSLTLNDFHEGNGGSGRYVAITFDDGNYSDYSLACPILSKYGFRATFFVTTDRIGTKGHVGWSIIREMADAGMSVQSHGVSHKFLSDLSREEMYGELYASKNLIEGKICRPVHYISLPGGSCSRRVLRLAEEAGYKGVCTSKPGPTSLPIIHRSFAVFSRYVIHSGTTFKRFKNIADNDAYCIARSTLLHEMKSVTRKVIGNRRYYALWSRYFKETKA
jgi:peptidoglycan/xylan/chitin deacetylase (PgdA/CDA1 family)